MTKKQAARKRKLRAKKRAEQKAAEQEQQKAQEQPQAEPEQDNKEEKKKFESLIVYDAKMAQSTDTPRDYSDAFKELMKHISAIIEKYSPLWAKAEEMWKQKGKDQPCPKEAYEIYQKALNGCQEEFSTLIKTTYPQYADKMYLEENEFLDAQFTAVNKFLEEMGKHISSIHPESIEAEFKAPSTEVKSTEVTTVDAETATAIVTQGTQGTPSKDKKKETEPANILTYEDWGKLTHDTSNVWKEINENQKKLNLLKWVDFVKSGFHPLDWFTDRIWSFINSAVVSDFIKTFMYANPLTAMIYDGKLLNFGFKDALTAIHNQCLKQRQERDANKGQSEKDKQDKYFYNKRGIPKDLSKCTLNQLNQEFYGNPMFIDWVNLCYHHTEIDPNEQLEVKKMVRLVKAALKEQDRAKAVKQVTALCTKINKLADMLEINTA